MQRDRQPRIDEKTRQERANKCSPVTEVIGVKERVVGEIEPLPFMPQEQAAGTTGETGGSYCRGRPRQAARAGSPSRPRERKALEAIAQALNERRSLVLTHATYDREASQSGVIVNLANVVPVRVSKTDSAATGQYL